MSSQLHCSLLSMWINCDKIVVLALIDQSILKQISCLIDRYPRQVLDGRKQGGRVFGSKRDKNKMIQLIPINCHGFEK